MIRLFVAIELPEDVRESLSHLQAGLPGARWTPPENMHLTLRFIGEVQEPAVDEIGEALWRIRAEGFSLALKGLGKFGGESKRSPARTLFVGVEPNRALSDLASRIEQSIVDAGFPPETRKFHAHITLARLKDTPPHRLGDYIAEHSLYSARPFDVREFALVSSLQGKEASVYDALQFFPPPPPGGRGPG